MELWDVVEAANKDRHALAATLRAVPSEMKVGLVMKKLAKEAWDVVKSMRVGDDRVKSVSLQHLSKEYENAIFHDGEFVDEFMMSIKRLVASLRELGKVMEDSHMVRKILHVVPKKLS
jgi:DNA-binding phage protein